MGIGTLLVVLLNRVIRIERYFYLVFPFSVALYLHLTTFWWQILHFLLTYVITLELVCCIRAQYTVALRVKTQLSKTHFW